MSMKSVTIYTDGACKGNPGPGGYGTVLIYRDFRKEISGGFRRTTNNRMEMMAAIVGLKLLKQACQVTLYSDSKYIVDAMRQGWAKRWKAKGWWRNKKERAKNPDLWEELLRLSEFHQVEFVWVKGHAGNKENECCDRLAVAASKAADLPADEIFERGEA
ncbi:ribonuclease HI [Phormidium yuhuli AB48]|uniref:Ribonuclease H n=2 Tax=Phormidium TaxID=1198 RepID=A0ABY5AQN6_9CYAN|nr:ribonuclease HI [Phormidium yuhuli]USR91547.1 ribonuclease HI [Phormidium yuhuli AB48]